MSNEKRVVDFGADPTYADRIAKAKGSAIPVGGAPMPAIPRLDSSPVDKNAPSRPQVKAETLLTPEARKALEADGRLRPGVGSAYAANQPTAQTPSEEPYANPPRPEGAGLRPETIEQLEVVAAATQKSVPEEDKIAQDLSDAEAGFNFAGFGQQARSLINNRKRRELIESRITDVLDFADLLTHMEMRQQVPIIPGKFVPTYRSLGGHEDIWIKRQMGIETGSETYITDRYAMMNLTAALYAINGKILPTHLDKEGMVDAVAFDQKYRLLLRYPIQILSDLSVNFVWFYQRVERTLVVDDIKGF